MEERVEEEEPSGSWCDVVLPLGEAAGTFNLEAAVCSHGLFMMSPNHWDPPSKSLLRPLRLSLLPSAAGDASGSLLVRVSRPSVLPDSLLLRVHGTSRLSPPHRVAVVAQVRRMLRLSEAEERKVRQFWEVHGEAKKRRFGRVFRSPTLFEDMVKCILLCNCQWPRTLSMARALCELQLELQDPSRRVSTREFDHTNFKTATVQTEHFTPGTPAAKEADRRHKCLKCPKVLCGGDAVDTMGNDGISRMNCAQVSHCTSVQDNSLPIPVSTKKEDYSCESDMHTKAVRKCEAASGEREPCSYPEIGNFPSPEEIASVDEMFLAKRCNLGYRAGRILKLAQDIVEGRIELKQLEELCADFSLSNYVNADEKLKVINGFGPFTRGNVLMCMGFYNVVPADSETMRHLKQVHARSTTTHTVQRAVEELYREFEPFQFLAYWWEVWSFYEEWFGKLSEMPQSGYKLITASNMRIKKRKRT